MKDKDLRKFYTIEVFLDYSDLPKNFREGWSPSFRLHFEKMGMGVDENLTQKLLKKFEIKLIKLYSNIRFNLRNIKLSEADYRRMKALDEARSNTLQILNLFKNI